MGIEMAIFYIVRMNGGDVELTQVVSQMSGPTIVPLSDDLLQTQRMTIEDLIETSEVEFLIYEFLYLFE